MKTEKEKLTEQLIRHEALRLRLYRCPAGSWTIGVGRNLDVNGISEAEAMLMLENDIRAARLGLAQVLTGYRISLESVSQNRFAALTNVCFNIGISSLRGFVRMFAAIRAGDWNGAGDELLDSEYAREVGRRADELAAQLKTGEYQEVVDHAENS